MPLLNRSIANSVLKFTRKYQQTQTKIQGSIPFPNGPVFKNAQYFPERVALRDSIASYTYGNIFLSAHELSKEINKLTGGSTNERVVFLCPNDANFVISLWAIWMAGHIAVPLSPLHPKNILLYYVNDTRANLLITTPHYADLMQRISKNTHSRLHILDDKLKLNCAQKILQSRSDLEAGFSQDFYLNNDAMILYTSGTTGSPKGVIYSHKNLQCQITTLLDAWKWTSNDVILHTLPLHHVHGIVNALLCPLYIGAKTIMLKKFNANTVWSYLLGVNAKPDDRKITVYMAVPTIYSKLIEEYKKVFKDDAKMVEYIKNTLQNKVRLMVSGSSPLPVPTYQKWLEISGHRLLERYGMTETGMVLSNVYDSDREPGYVGVPLPGVSVRLAEETDSEIGEMKTIIECSNEGGTIVFRNYKSGTPRGELLVKGDGVFQEYHNRPDATREEFTADGWFKTGDYCEYSTEKKKFKMLGRKNEDIIKCGGYKISALEIETQMLGHPDIKECAVVGIDDEEWGQKVAAVIVPQKDKDITLDILSKWAENKMPKYSIPTILNVVGSLPKNSMGKVNKKEIVKTLF